MQSPLIEAIRNWQNYDDIYQTIDFLVDQQHIDMELTDYRGQKALDYAFVNDTPYIALHLLKKGANSKDAFQKAITYHHECIATWLIQNKLALIANYAYWNDENNCLATALIWSIHLGWDSTASAIIDDPLFVTDIMDWYSNCFIGVYSPMLFAIYKGNDFLIDKIMSKNPTLSGYDFHKAIALGCNRQTAERFLHAGGIDYNHIFDNDDDDDEDISHGNSLLHTAVEFANHDVIILFITSRRVDDTIKNKNGKTPGECYGSKWGAYKSRILLDCFVQDFGLVGSVLEKNVVDTYCLESVLQYYCGDCGV
jgi:hypothetical protein